MLQTEVRDSQLPDLELMWRGPFLAYFRVSGGTGKNAGWFNSMENLKHKMDKYDMSWGYSYILGHFEG